MLEQRSVGLHHGHRRKGGRRDEFFYRLQLVVGLRRYRFHGIACAYGRKLSSMLVILYLLLLQLRGSCPVRISIRVHGFTAWVRHRT
jgi:hypothetical protein